MTSYTYNTYGQRLTRTLKDAKGVATERRRYDALGRLVEIVENGKSVQFQYDAKGRIIGQSLNGLPVTLTYTQLGLPCTKVWGSNATPLATLKYLYDKDGNLVGREINGKRQAYVQGSRGQLLAVKDADGNPLEEYRYDPAGNILSKTVNGRTTVFTYDGANQLVSSECDGKVTQYDYDASGRMVRDGGRTYHYGWLDKVTAITENGKPYATYDYHVDGQLALAKYADRQEDFLWDGLALVRRNNNSYINEPHPGGGAPVVSSADGVLLNDMLGTTLGTADGTNARMTGITAFGETNDNAALFTGKPMVDGLGYAFLLRNYQPQNGKWLTADPIGFPDGWNNLTYCNNHILFSIDIFGAKELSVVFITNYTVSGDDDAFRESGRYDYVLTNISSIEMMVRVMEVIKNQGDSIKNWCVSGHANGSVTGAYFADMTTLDINSFTSEQIARANSCLAPKASYSSFGCYVGTNEAGLTRMVNAFSNLESASGYTGQCTPGDGVRSWLNIILDWYDGKQQWFTTKYIE